MLFSNLNYGEFTGQDELISNVALATSAAPIYLPPQTFTGNRYIDGAVYLNNPSQFGLTAGKMVKPTANRYCVLSIGTGLGKTGFHEEDDPNQPPPPSFPFEQTVKDLVSTLDASIAGAQEAVARSLFLEDQYTLNKLYPYRFQTVLDPNINTDLDNSDNSFLTYLTNVATTEFNADIDNVSTFLGHLTA